MCCNGLLYRMLRSPNKGGVLSGRHSGRGIPYPELSLKRGIFVHQKEGGIPELSLAHWFCCHAIQVLLLQMSIFPDRDKGEVKAKAKKTYVTSACSQALLEFSFSDRTSPAARYPGCPVFSAKYMNVLNKTEVCLVTCSIRQLATWPPTIFNPWHLCPV